MTIILSIREFFQKIYSRYYLQVTIVLKFLLGLLVFSTINTNIGFMERLDSSVVVVGLAALCSFLPPMIMVLSAIALIAAHLYALSTIVMAITLLVFILLYIFYFRFVPGKTWPILLVPMAFFFEMPLVIPLIFGLLGSPLMIVPAIAGTIVFHILHYIINTETVYAVEGVQEMMDTSTIFITSIVANREQWLIAFVMGVGVLIIYAIRTRSFDHSWKVAIAAGVVWLFAGFHLGSAFFEMEAPIENLVANLILVVIVGIALEFLFFRVDYSRTEYLQFDDSEYFYYVKAIPKRFSEGWVIKQERVREREEREKEKQRQRRREELVGRNEEELPGRAGQGRRGQEANGLRAREPRANRPDDRSPGRRFSDMLPSPHLRRRKGEEDEENLEETTIIEAGQVSTKIKDLGLKAAKKMNLAPGGQQVPENKQISVNLQELGSKQVSVNKQASEKKPDIDKSLGLEPKKEFEEVQKKEPKSPGGNKRKNQGGSKKV